MIPRLIRYIVVLESCVGESPNRSMLVKIRKHFLEQIWSEQTISRKFNGYCSHVGDKKVSVHNESLSNRIKEVLGRTTSKTIYELQNCVMKKTKQNYTWMRNIIWNVKPLEAMIFPKIYLLWVGSTVKPSYQQSKIYFISIVLRVLTSSILYLFFCTKTNVRRSV